MKPQVKAIPITELSPMVESLVNEGILVEFRVTGSSMRPMLSNIKDTVILAKLTRPLKRGDIAFYKRSNDTYILHRVIKVNGEVFDAIGDHQTEIEHNVPTKNVIAVVESFTRNGKAYKTTNIGYKLYSVLWMLLIPLRSLIFKISPIIRNKKSR